MSADGTLQDFFRHVLQLHRTEFTVSDSKIEEAMAPIQIAYSKQGQWLGATREPLNYNDPAYRCAYLHKYATCHAALVRDILADYLIQSTHLKNTFYNVGTVNVCCIGGGPGSDFVGVSSLLSTMEECKGNIFHFTTIDCMSGWSSTNETIKRAAASGLFGSLGQILADRVRTSYVCDNILNATEESIQAMRAADLLTMIKFVSAANPQDVQDILQLVFTSMKPGALVLFVDNSGGGFYEKVCRAATVCGLESHCTPRTDMVYRKQEFKCQLYGSSSLSYTKVSAQLWEKP